MKIFENTTALAAATLTAGQMVETKGYSSAGDGGGARYLIEAAGASFDGYVNHQLANGNVATIQHNGLLIGEQAGAVNGSGDSLAQLDAAIAFADSARIVFDFRASKFLISGFLSIPSTLQTRAGSRASIEPFGGYTGDAIIIGQGNGQYIELPNIANFSSGTGLTILGTDATNIRIETIAGCNTGVKFKTVNSVTGQDKLLNSTVTLQQIGNCKEGIVFESDHKDNVMQGNEVYCNFVSVTDECVVFDDLGLHTATADWDSNLIRLQAYDPLGLTTQRLLVNRSSFAVPRLTLKVQSWLGGFDGPSPKIFSGGFEASSFELQMAQSIVRGMMDLTGNQNEIIIRNRDSLASSVVSALTASAPSSFNGGVHLWKRRSKVRLTTIATLLAGQTATFFVYHTNMCGGGASVRGATDGPISVSLAGIKPFSWSLLATTNAANVENEIIIRVTNTSNTTISAGEVLDIWLVVE